MPFLSKAQQRWGHSSAGIEALGGKEKVAEWDKSTGGRPLPERKGKTKMQKAQHKLKSAMKKKRGGVIGQAIGAYKNATKSVQKVGYQIAKNTAQAQADFKSGKAPYYAATPTLKGTGKAFMSAFKSQRKLKRAMTGKK